MIRRNRGLLLLAVLTVLVGLVMTFPARIAYRWLSPPFVQLSGIQGTVWNGSALEFATNGVYLRDLTWQMRPLRLLTGKAHYHINGTPLSGFLESDVSLSVGGTVALSNLTAAVPLQMFASASNVTGLGGNASLQFERLELSAGRAVAMNGSIDIANLSVPFLSSSTLGGYRADFYTQENGIVASVEDTDGVVDIAGSLQLNPDKTYAFLGQIVAKPGTPESLGNQLRYLPENERGQRELRLEGEY